MWRVSCGGRRTVAERDKNRKVDREEEKKKNKKSDKKMGWKNMKFVFAKWSSGGSTPDPNQEGSDSSPSTFEPMVPPERPY